MKRVIHLLFSGFFVMFATTVVRGAPPESVNLRRTVVVDVAERTKDAVVYISTHKIISQRFSPFGDPFFDQFMGPDSVRRVPSGSLGSGFIIHPDGYIVTNNHVVDRARQIEVELLDGRKLPAELISCGSRSRSCDPEDSSDKPLPTLELGDSSDLLVGEPTIAVGNPAGLLAHGEHRHRLGAPS
jgi:serine protease Do